MGNDNDRPHPHVLGESGWPRVHRDHAESQVIAGNLLTTSGHPTPGGSGRLRSGSNSLTTTRSWRTNPRPHPAGGRHGGRGRHADHHIGRSPLATSRVTGKEPMR